MDYSLPVSSVLGVARMGHDLATKPPHHSIFYPSKNSSLITLVNKNFIKPFDKATLDIFMSGMQKIWIG